MANNSVLIVEDTPVNLKVMTWIRREKRDFRAVGASIWRPWRVSFLRGFLSSGKVGV